MSKHRFILSDKLALEGGDDGYVLVDISNASMTACNETAWQMLTALQEGATIHDLKARLTEHFEVDDEAAERDAKAFIGQLTAMGLIDDAA